MTGSKPCIAPPSANETERVDAIASLRAPEIKPAFAAEQSPAQVSAQVSAPARGKRSEVRAAAALFMLLLGLMTVAGVAVMVVLFR